MTSSDIAYREAVPQDMPSIIDLVHSVRGDDRNLDYLQFIVACDKDKIIGAVRTVQAEADCKELASLVVLPEYRTKGIGSTLVRKILEKDRSRPLYLVCFRNRLNFYNRHGFYEVDLQFIPKTLQRDFTRMKEEKGLDIVVMELM